MGLLCKIGIHSWDGCKCNNCAKTKDENHDWGKDCNTCSKCGTSKEDNHKWKGSKCTKCGKTKGKNSESKSNQKPTTTLANTLYFEKDNIGSRYLTADKNQAAYSTWASNGMIPHGNIYYGFQTKEEAYKAMSEISCIKIASDSKNLICLEIIEFGVYWDSYNDKYWEAFLQGPSLTLSVFQEAEKVFIKHKGIKISSKEPESKETKQDNKANKSNDNNIKSVKFVRNTVQNVYGFECIKDIYEAPDKGIAIEFLKTKSINKKHYYIEIETPAGWVGKDIDGVYEF